MRLLRAARHAQRYPATDTKRGRPSKWQREELFKVVAHFGDILDRETSSHTSFASFVDHYLRLLAFPADVLAVLEHGAINLFEAEQLARITARRLGVTTSAAMRTRTDLLAAHLHTKASGARLRQRVNELLSPAAPEIGPLHPAMAPPPADLEDFDPHDSTHLFWEQLKQLGFAFREIRPEDVTTEEIEELLTASEPILTILNRIQRRKAHPLVR